MATELADNGGVAVGWWAVDVDRGVCVVRYGVVILCPAGSGGGEGEAESITVGGEVEKPCTIWHDRGSWY